MTAARGGTSFEEGFNQKALTHGRLLVNQLAILVKVAQMHDLKNVAVEKAADALLANIREFSQERKTFSLNLVGDYLFLEDIRIKYNIEDFNNFDFLVSELKKRKLGTINFNAAVIQPELIAFVQVFLSADLSLEELYPDLVRRLAGAGVAGITTEELKPPKADEGFEKVVDTYRAAIKAYIRVILRIKEVFEAMDRGAPPDMRKLKRSVQSMVDSTYKAEPALLRLSAIRRKEDLLFRHYVNVCVLSLCIGKRLGLSKYQMARLGMAAVLHDVGRHGMPEDLFGEGMEPDESAFGIISRHPRLGVEKILKLKGLNEVAVSAMIVAYEHHRNLDGSGYPELVEPKEMSLFSKIVRIADNYDSSTSAGIYGQIPMPPPKALEVMLARTDKYYDAGLLKNFARVAGRYPVGSFLMLSDGSMGVVSSPGTGADGFDRPKVTLITGLDTGREVDLKEKDGSGGYAREAVRVLDPYQYRVNIYRHLV